MRGEVGDGLMRKASGLMGEKRDAGRAARPADRTGDRAGAPHGAAGALWDVADVSAYLQMPVSSIYKMTARRAPVRIPHIRIGGAIRFRQADVDQWLTVLTTSNIKALAKVRQKFPKVTYGHDP